MKVHVPKQVFEEKVVCDGCELDISPVVGWANNTSPVEDLHLCPLCVEAVFTKFKKKPYKIKHNFNWPCGVCGKQQTHRDLEGYGKCDPCLKEIRDKLSAPKPTANMVRIFDKI